MTIRSFVVLGLSLVLGLAIFGIQIAHAVKTGREFDRYLTVKGLSERDAKADLAIWPIRFAVAADDLGNLKSGMEFNRAIVLAYLKSSKIGSNEINEGLPDITDRQDLRIQSGTPALARYRALVTMVVRSTNVDIVKRTIQGADSLLEKGVSLGGEDQGQQTQFIFNALNDVKPEMIREATANARASAEKFAEDSHSKVGRIRKATQGVLEIEDRDAASPEWKTLRIVTTVDFFLE
ncbi:MAG TPA: SIMPL domain-containing protein [Verrucomicrobiae bacterium]|jgi:hypothetical protein|nr:SIMPL domain-containing protein [Verrucomicrobiae bacterium]